MRPSAAMKLLLVAAVLLAVLAGIVDALVPSAVPPEARDAFAAVLRARPPASGAVVALLAAAYWALLLGAIVGMFRGRRWGLWLGVAVTVVTVVQAVVIAPHAYSGAAFAISYASKVAWGAALALAWIATGERAANEPRVRLA
jgi:hypothetical protein